MSETGTPLDIAEHDGGVRLVGELDAHTAGRLEQALAALVGGPTTIRIGIEDLTFMDSSGLRVVVAATEQARVGGGDLVLVGPTSLVRRLLDVSGLSNHLTIEDAPK